jgi:hypothetical protein
MGVENSTRGVGAVEFNDDGIVRQVGAATGSIMQGPCLHRSIPGNPTPFGIPPAFPYACRQLVPLDGAPRDSGFAVRQ